MEDFFEALVLSGGGMKGIGELGPVMYYQEQNRLEISRIKVFSGTSAGSLINLLLFAGYTPLEILEEGCAFGDFLEVSKLSSLTEIFTKTFGLWSIRPLIKNIEKLVLIKLGKIPTLGEIYTSYGKEFIVAVTNNTLRRGEYFSHRTRPNLLVTDAVKISCSLPLIFHRIKFRNHYYSDGGSFDNCPFYPVNPRLKTLCIAVGGTDYYGQSLLPAIFKELVPYLYNIVTTPIVLSTRKQLLHIGPNVTLIEIYYENVPLLALGTDRELKKKMFLQSYKEAERVDSIERIYVRGWSWDQPPLKAESTVSATDVPPEVWDVDW